MFKRLLLLCCGLAFAVTGNVRGQFKPETSVGINTGIDFSRVSFTPSVNQNLLSSFAAGLIVRHISEPHIGLQLEATFAGKGWIEDLDSLGTYTRELNVIHLPVQAVFVAGSKSLRLSFTLGPYLSWLMDQEEVIAVPDEQDYQDYYGKPLPGRWEFGFTGGLGVEWHTRIGAFGLRAVYNHSLTNIFPLNADDFYYNTSRMQFLHAGMTYFITL